jgi:hypothetical protein
VVNYGSGGGFSSRPEDMRITSLSDVAATFTAVVGTNNYVTAAGIFSEAATVSVSTMAPMPFYSTIHLQE